MVLNVNDYQTLLLLRNESQFEVQRMIQLEEKDQDLLIEKQKLFERTSAILSTIDKTRKYQQLLSKDIDFVQISHEKRVKEMRAREQLSLENILKEDMSYISQNQYGEYNQIGSHPNQHLKEILAEVEPIQNLQINGNKQQINHNSSKINKINTGYFPSEVPNQTIKKQQINANYNDLQFNSNIQNPMVNTVKINNFQQNYDQYQRLQNTTKERSQSSHSRGNKSTEIPLFQQTQETLIQLNDQHQNNQNQQYQQQSNYKVIVSSPNTNDMNDLQQQQQKQEIPYFNQSQKPNSQKFPKSNNFQDHHEQYHSNSVSNISSPGNAYEQQKKYIIEQENQNHYQGQQPYHGNQQGIVRPINNTNLKVNQNQQQNIFQLNEQNSQNPQWLKSEQENYDDQHLDFQRKETSRFSYQEKEIPIKSNSKEQNNQQNQQYTSVPHSFSSIQLPTHQIPQIQNNQESLYQKNQMSKSATTHSNSSVQLQTQQIPSIQKNQNYINEQDQNNTQKYEKNINQFNQNIQQVQSNQSSIRNQNKSFDKSNQGSPSQSVKSNSQYVPANPRSKLNNSQILDNQKEQQKMQELMKQKHEQQLQQLQQQHSQQYSLQQKQIEEQLLQQQQLQQQHLQQQELQQQQYQQQIIQQQEQLQQQQALLQQQQTQLQQQQEEHYQKQLEQQQQQIEQQQLLEQQKQQELLEKQQQIEQQQKWQKQQKQQKQQNPPTRNIRKEIEIALANKLHQSFQQSGVQTIKNSMNPQQLQLMKESNAINVDYSQYQKVQQLQQEIYKPSQMNESYLSQNNVNVQIEKERLQRKGNDIVVYRNVKLNKVKASQNNSVNQNSTLNKKGIIQINKQANTMKNSNASNKQNTDYQSQVLNKIQSQKQMYKPLNVSSSQNVVQDLHLIQQSQDQNLFNNVSAIYYPPSNNNENYDNSFLSNSNILLNDQSLLENYNINRMHQCEGNHEHERYKTPKQYSSIQSHYNPNNLQYYLNKDFRSYSNNEKWVQQKLKVDKTNNATTRNFWQKKPNTEIRAKTKDTQIKKKLTNSNKNLQSGINELNKSVSLYKQQYDKQQMTTLEIPTDNKSYFNNGSFMGSERKQAQIKFDLRKQQTNDDDESGMNPVFNKYLNDGSMSDRSHYASIYPKEFDRIKHIQLRDQNLQNIHQEILNLNDRFQNGIKNRNSNKQNKSTYNINEKTEDQSNKVMYTTLGVSSSNNNFYQPNWIQINVLFYSYNLIKKGQNRITEIG